MDKGILKDLLDFYQNQLLVGYYKKRGKALVVPNVLFSIDKLLSVKGRSNRKVKILDVGTGKGDLLRLLSQMAKSGGFRDKIELYGMDYDEDLIDYAKTKNGEDFEFVVKDLRYDLLDDLKGKFDIVVTINTLHEVFTSLLGVNEKLDVKKYKAVNGRVAEMIGRLSSMLTNDGYLIIYDGLDVSDAERSKEVTFQIKKPDLARYFVKFVSEYKPWKLRCKEINKNTFTMNMMDFCRFITTFKYLNTKLWPIESRESYAYMNIEEFKTAFDKAGLLVDSMTLVNNDLGIWGEYVELLDDASFPTKAIIWVTSMSYLPSTYDFA